ncbi:SH3-domain-containing protein [Athelia psychrophila]|uniref:SH3-domain-containing protein n=1 Tax=Athelia psychrophila TaxID=1759441 RepID=A0A166GSH0_9AGAM|nr:SH3-domain-containing protein [Fibularhizoctonia sp. CBS 109695]
MEAAMEMPKVKRSSVGGISSVASNLSMHPAIKKLPMNDFTDDSAVKFYLNRKADHSSSSSIMGEDEGLEGDFKAPAAPVPALLLRVAAGAAGASAQSFGDLGKSAAFGGAAVVATVGGTGYEAYEEEESAATAESTAPPPPSPPMQAAPKPEPEHEEEVEPVTSPPPPRTPPLPPPDPPVAQMAALSVAPESMPPQPAYDSTGEGGLRAFVEYDYLAGEDNEVDLVEGEVVTDIEQFDEGWWSGTNSSGKNGLFPANYVELIKEEPKAAEEAAPPPLPLGLATVSSIANPSPVKGEGGLRAFAEYDFPAEEDDEVDLVEGEVVTDVEQHNEDWWSGTNPSGKTGLFPANHVRLTKKAPEAAPPPPPPEAAGEDATAIAQYDYQATEENELSFAEDDRIIGIEIASDEWWQGMDQHGNVGLFPANYVEVQD